VVPVLAAQMQGSYREGLITNLLQQLTQDQGLVRDLLAAGAVEAALREIQDSESPACDKLAADSMLQPMFLLHASSARRAAAAGGLLVLTAELGSAAAVEERGFWTSTIMVLLPGCGPQQLQQALSAGLLQQLQDNLPRTENQELQEPSLVLLTQQLLLIKALVPALKAGRHAEAAEPLAAQLVALLQRPADLAECVVPLLIPLVYASARAARAEAAAGAEAAAPRRSAAPEAGHAVLQALPC
jgi:hypothetical protein